MRIREVAKQSRARRGALASLVAAAALVPAACGEDDFENEPRPPIPVELTAAIDDRAVSLSPSTVGAGLVNITVSNQTDEPTRLTLEGPTTASTTEIPPGGTQTIKTELQEGEYDVAAGAEIDIKPDTLEVGPERPTSQNELLQP
jgi:hypothetical protein